MWNTPILHQYSVYVWMCAIFIDVLIHHNLLYTLIIIIFPFAALELETKKKKQMRKYEKTKKKKKKKKIQFTFIVPTTVIECRRSEKKLIVVLGIWFNHLYQITHRFHLLPQLFFAWNFKFIRLNEMCKIQRNKENLLILTSGLNRAISQTTEIPDFFGERNFLCEFAYFF